MEKDDSSTNIGPSMLLNGPHWGEMWKNTKK